MKIFLPFKVQDIGGTSTFARKFKDGMEKNGHQVTFEYQDDYDLLFLIVQCPLKYLLDAKRKGKKIVQRLDGTYYWTVANWKFPLLNAKACYIRHLFTDFTIYQSKYSMMCANRFLGRKRNDKHAIIYNGVDLDLFNPKGKKAIQKKVDEKKVFFTASAFRREDQIIPVIKALDIYQQKYGNKFTFYIAGNFTSRVESLPDALKEITFVRLLGKISNSDLPAYERSADVFLFTHLNPPCPNNVIEAMATGLPICGINDGSMSELVTSGKNGQLLTVRGNGFWRKRFFNASEFADNLHNILTQQATYSHNCREMAEKRFSLHFMSRKYSQVFEKLAR